MRRYVRGQVFSDYIRLMLLCNCIWQIQVLKNESGYLFRPIIRYVLEKISSKFCPHHGSPECKAGICIKISNFQGFMEKMPFYNFIWILPLDIIIYIFFSAKAKQLKPKAIHIARNGTIPGILSRFQIFREIMK